MTPHIALYGSHDSNLCVKVGPNEYRVYELERLTGIRNYRLNTDANFESVLTRVYNIIRAEYGYEKYSSLFYGQLSKQQVEIAKRIFGVVHTEEMSHHPAHAACAAYQSPYDECLVFSSDGGGHEMNEGITSMALFHVNKKGGYNNCVTKICTLPFDFCHPYTLLAIPINEIWKKDAMTDYLKYAGKLMGLAGYGKVREEWLSHFRGFFMTPASQQTLAQLGGNIGLDFSDINTISGQQAYDVAATGQRVFETLSLEIFTPFAERYKLPICLTGGGALNVLCNQRFYESFNVSVFIPCNPNDCGLSFGFMMLRDMPESGIAHIQYSGFGILDKEDLPNYAKRFNAKKCDYKQLARMLCDGKIIGVMRGSSECGPRALGNRSILAHAKFPDMKDRLNKIKAREFYRPVAPVCRLEGVSKFFIFGGESPFMSFAPKERVKLVGGAISGVCSYSIMHDQDVKSAIHVDGTARLQTVTQEQNDWLYSLLDAVDTISGVPVLINTSLNVKGRPIATTIEDALLILHDTDIDAVLIEGYLFEKK